MKIFTDKPQQRLTRFTSRALFTIVGGSVLINPVFAQETQPENVDEVVVTGLRASLQTAQAIKLDSDTFVEIGRAHV